MYVCGGQLYFKALEPCFRLIPLAPPRSGTSLTCLGREKGRADGCWRWWQTDAVIGVIGLAGFGQGGVGIGPM